MNMILHDYATAEIKQGNTLTHPKFMDATFCRTAFCSAAIPKLKSAAT